MIALAEAKSRSTTDTFARMEAAALDGPLPGEVCFALRLEQLHPDRDLDAADVQRDAVAVLMALEGQRDARFVQQTVCRPDPVHPERGSIEIDIITVVRGEAGERPTNDRLVELWDDLRDVLSAPPLRWEFRSVTDPAELDRVLRPFEATSFAEIARREEACAPTSWTRSGGVGFGGEPGRRELSRELWSMWTFGTPSDDLRRVASALLAQEAPIAIRVALAPTALTPAERGGIEELMMAVGPLAEGNALSYASLRTLEALLYLRPVFDARCVVASPEPISRALLSSIGHAMSEPTKHGDPLGSPVLAGGFAALRGGVDVDEAVLAEAFHTMSSGQPGPSLAPPGLERLRRILGPWEAANAFRVPVTDDDFPGMRSLQVPDLEPPVSRLPRSGRRIGSLTTHGKTPVLIDAEDRFRHLYVSGQTGTGKSTLLLNLALQDIGAGDGVAVLDPHGDLVESLLCRIPDDRLDDVVLIDPADQIAVPGVNLLEAETAVQEEYVVSELCNMFYALFDPNRVGIIGPRYETMLRQAALLLLANKDEPASFLDITTLFVDAAVRNHLLEGVRDPILTEFWLGEMTQTTDFHKSEVLSWFRSKFEIFRTSRLVRNVVGQSKSTISFSDILKERRILLVNLSKGLLGEYNSALIGHIVFTRLWAAALERASVPAEERSDFFVYIDEFQNVTSASLPSVLSEARKFRVGLTIANQFFSQVPEATRDAIMGNVGSRVTFRVGPKDALPFAGWLGQDVDADDLTRLPNHIGVAALTDRGVPLDPFVLRTDPPTPPVDDDRAELARARSRKQWARPVNELDDAFFGRWAHVQGSMSWRMFGSKRDEDDDDEQEGDAAAQVRDVSSVPAALRHPVLDPRHSFVEEWIIDRLVLGRSSVDLVDIRFAEKPDQIMTAMRVLRRYLVIDLTAAKRLIDAATEASFSGVRRNVAEALRFDLGLTGAQLLVDPPEPSPEETEHRSGYEARSLDLLSSHIDVLGLGERPKSCLRRASIESVGQLLANTATDLLAITNFGPRSLEEVETTLAARGLTLSTMRSALTGYVAMDQEWLEDVGLADLLPPDEASFVASARCELESRLRRELGTVLDEESFERFDEASDAFDDVAVGAILESVAGYQELVAEHFRTLSEEIREAAATIGRELGYVT